MRKMILCFFVFFFTSTCDFIYNDPEKKFIIHDKSNYGDLFLSFWRTISDNYPFDIPKWAEVYYTYIERFKNLSTGLSYEGEGNNLNTYNQNKAIKLFKEIIKDNIKDGHFVLERVNSKDVKYKPLREKKPISNSYHQFYPELEASLRDFGFTEVKKVIEDTSSPFEKEKDSEHKSMKMFLYENKEKKIIYFHLDSFCIKQAYEKNDTRRIDVIETFYKMIRSYNKNNKVVSVVLALQNRGGRVEDIEFFISRFLDKPFTYSYSRIKKGPLGYFPWVPETIYPHAEHFDLKKLNMVILVNENTISLGETATVILNKHTIGENTFGAFAPIMAEAQEEGEVGYSKDFNMGGNYKLGGNGKISLSMQMGIAAMKVYDKKTNSYKVLEGKGITPDEKVSGHREQLRSAIEYVKNLKP